MRFTISVEHISFQPWNWFLLLSYKIRLFWYSCDNKILYINYGVSVDVVKVRPPKTQESLHMC